jgi:hypothetical protein
VRSVRSVRSVLAEVSAAMKGSSVRRWRSTRRGKAPGGSAAGSGGGGAGARRARLAGGGVAPGGGEAGSGGGSAGARRARLADGGVAAGVLISRLLLQRDVAVVGHLRIVVEALGRRPRARRADRL